MNILVESQDGKFIGYCKYLGIGKRKEKEIIGDELIKILNEKNITPDDLVKKIGSNYKRTIERILKNEEIPTPKVLKMITNSLELNEEHFKEKNLENVIVTDSNVVVATYETNEIAKEKFNKAKQIIISKSNGYVSFKEEK